MKSSNIFLIVFLIIAIVFSGVSAVVSSVGLAGLRSNTNESVTLIIANLRDKYPELTDRDIVQILNGTADTADTQKMLRKYGIDSDDWVVYSDESICTKIIIANASVCVMACALLCAVYVIYNRKRKREIQQITDYITQINRKNYDLSIDKNSEDETSLLKNEIYKTTVMLKEQSENSLRDKENLKDSLSDISHQIKTPLTSVMVMLDSIIDNQNMPEDIRKEFLCDIKHSANSISFLVQSILTLSKLDANSIVLRKQRENLKSILDESVRSTAMLAEIKAVEVISQCDDNVEIECDAKWLGEAITNIVKNCIEHTDKGGFVKITAWKNKLYAKITVMDNGRGIAREDLPHIFERFYKGKNSSEDSVGIGLALAKTIVEKNGGFISVSSELGKGTTFVIKYFN